ncbi:regulator [Streptomyces albus subsp. albus]|nr:regulator [Streptomyces albus subsp. albus]
MAASDLQDVVWQKSGYSNSQGSCVEFAKLPGGEVAVRNSRFPDGPALIYTPAEIAALLLGAKDGEFDHLVHE